MNLTEEQQLILENCNQNIFISAAPGSGKSTMLSEICKKLLTDDPTYRLLLITFTNAAAKSILNKCSNLDQSRVTGGTFHSIAYRYLREWGTTSSICDEHKKRLIIKTLFKCRKDKNKFEDVYEQICTSKSCYPYAKNSILDAYQTELQKYNLLDFDDIITKFIEVSNRQSRSNISCTHLLVDELQDTSGPQFEMLKSLKRSESSTRKIRIIGVADDDQCIYEWRGARPENVRDFIAWSTCRVFGMGVNFRSNSTIVRHSANLISHNTKRIPKDLRSYTTKTGLVASYECANPFDEVDYIVAKCQQNLGKHTAILYRNRTFKYHLEFKLRKAGLKYKVNDFLDITDRSAVRAVMACLKIACNSYDYFDVEQAAKALKGIGTKTLAKLKVDIEAAKESPKLTFMRWLADAKLKSKLNSITNLQNSFKTYENQPLNFLAARVEDEFVPSFDYQKQMQELIIDITRSYSATASDITELSNELGLDAKDDPSDDAAIIELSTVHGFKGLEDEVVIVPFAQMFLTMIPGREPDIEAERRLFYVAITRAKEKLYICYSGDKPQFVREMKL